MYFFHSEHGKKLQQNRTELEKQTNRSTPARPKDRRYVVSVFKYWRYFMTNRDCLL